MKKNLLYLGILVVLAVVAYFAFTKETSLFPKEDTNFQVKNTEDITEIFLSDPTDGNIKLTKQTNGTWLINDSFKAQKDWVDFLLDGLEKQHASQLIPKSMHNSAIKQLASAGIKVQVYQGDKKTHEFYVGKEVSKDNLTVMLNVRPDGKNSPRPYMVKYGVQSTFLGIRYKTGLEIWRDKQIFNFANAKIASIGINFLNKPANDYTITTVPTLSVTPAVTTGDTLNTRRLKKYVEFYDKMYVMGYENVYAYKDSIMQHQKPMARITVKATNGEQSQLDIYYRGLTKNTKYILTVDGKDYNGDSYFGWLDNQDFVLVNSTNVDKILRSRAEFFTADPAPKTLAE